MVSREIKAIRGCSAQDGWADEQFAVAKKDILSPSLAATFCLFPCTGCGDHFIPQ